MTSRFLSNAGVTLLMTGRLRTGRERKKAQDVTNRIFGKKGSTMPPGKANGASGSFATRAGVSKVRTTTQRLRDVRGRVQYD